MSYQEAFEAWDEGDIPDIVYPRRVMKTLMHEDHDRDRKPPPVDQLNPERGTLINTPRDFIDIGIARNMLDAAREECPASDLGEGADMMLEYQERRWEELKGIREFDAAKGFAKGVGVGLKGETELERRFGAWMVREGRCRGTLAWGR